MSTTLCGLSVVEDTLQTAALIDEAHFGVRYSSYHSFGRFDGQTGADDFGMLVWPGGTLSETRPDRFGFDYQDLYNSAGTNGKPGITAIFDYANTHDMGVSIVLPTAAYEHDPAKLIVDAQDFFSDLFSGTFGRIPKKLIFEVGNEHYGVFGGAEETAQAAAYASIVNVYANVVNTVEAIFNVPDAAVEYSVQIGRTQAANDAIISGLTDEAKKFADMLSHHRFSADAAATDDYIPNALYALNLWKTELGNLGEEAPNLYLSEYNVASMARSDAALHFIQNNPLGTGLSLSDIDLDGRTNSDFEAHYQRLLENVPAGLEHAEVLLQLFSEYTGIGAEAAGSYGWDLPHSGRMTLRGSDGIDYKFVPGELQSMMSESLEGTSVLDWYQQNDYSVADEVTVFGFNSADKLIVFLAAPKLDGTTLDVSIPLPGLAGAKAVWAESLTGQVPPNWKNLFNVKSNPSVDNTPESITYTVAQTNKFAPTVDDDSIDLKFSADYEIIRVSIAHTQAGIDDISSWHGSAPTLLSSSAYQNSLNLGHECDVDEASEDTDEMDDMGMGMAIGALLMALAGFGFA